MVVDCIIYAYDDDALNVRLEELKNVVDYTIIVEATTTFRGLPREPVLPTGKNVINVVIDLPYDDPWENERHQRDYCLTAATEHFSSETLLIIADADEIPNPKAIKMYKNPATLLTDYRQWYINWRAPDNNQLIHQPFIAPIKDIDTPTNDRHRRRFPPSRYTGWHLSGLGDSSLASKKLSSFSHSEYDTPYWNDIARLERTRLEGKDILNRFKLLYTDDVPSSSNLFPNLLGPPIG